MDLMQGLSSLFGEVLGGSTEQSKARGTAAGADNSLGALSSLVNPQMISGLMSALFSGGGKSGGKGNADGLMSLLGALTGGGKAGQSSGIASGLSSLLGTSQAEITAANRDVPGYGQEQSNPQEKITRILRAIIYAAKCDGHIDDQEAAAIDSQMKQLSLGADGQKVLRQIMAEPTDAQKIAQGIKDPNEAIEIYAISCAVVNINTMVERRYMDSLAQALGIPDNIKTKLEQQVNG